MRLSDLKLWIQAARPKTLIASISPVVLASCHFRSFSEDFPIIIFAGCLLFGIFVQISTNYFNDYLDFLSGADNDRSFGPRRMVAAGKIAGMKMRNIAMIVLLTAFVIGLVTLFLAKAPLWFLPLGILCLFLSYGYTGGPYPLAYHGLGDFFVILFFGFVAFEGTNLMLSYAVNLPWNPNLLLALFIGLLINNLLVVNNYRDYEEDKRNNKKTTVVLFGRKFALFIFGSSFVIPLVIFPLFQGNLSFVALSLLGFICLFLLIIPHKKRNFDMALFLTAMTICLYTLMHLLK